MKATELKKGSRYIMREKYWNLSDLFTPNGTKVPAKYHYIEVEYEGEQEGKYRVWDIRMKKGMYFLLSAENVEKNISNLKRSVEAPYRRK